MKNFTIYKITNIITNQCYIGQTGSIKKRLTDHKRKLLLGKHRNNYLQNSYNYYGKDSFTYEIIEENIVCPLVIDFKEKFYIKKYNSINKQFGFNCDSGGNLKKIVSEETRKKQSELKQGPKNNRFGIKGINHQNYGKKWTQEHIEVIKKASTGRVFSEESRKKISRILKLNNNMSKKVIDSSTGMVYNSVKEAYDILNYKETISYSGFLKQINKNKLPLRYYEEGER
jgi:group I intron endonuclease